MDFVPQLADSFLFKSNLDKPPELGFDWGESLRPAWDSWGNQR